MGHWLLSQRIEPLLSTLVIKISANNPTDLKLSGTLDLLACRCPTQMDRHLLTHHTWRLRRFEMPTERRQSNDALCQILHQSNSLIVLEVGVRRDLHTSTAVTETCWLPFMICWIIPMTPPVAASFLCSLKLRGRGPAGRLHVEALQDLQEAAKRY